jgi:putative transcriptional regulator
MDRRGVNKLWRERSRTHTPPPNPLQDPIAHIKRPLNALNEDRRGQGVVRRGQAVIEFDPMDVKHIRAKFAATQRQFARLIGISFETLRNWETGKRRPHGPARVDRVGLKAAVPDRDVAFCDLWANGSCAHGSMALQTQNDMTRGAAQPRRLAAEVAQAHNVHPLRTATPESRCPRAPSWRPDPDPRRS